MLPIAPALLRDNPTLVVVGSYACNGDRLERVLKIAAFDHMRHASENGVLRNTFPVTFLNQFFGLEGFPLFPCRSPPRAALGAASSPPATTTF